jgi:hypothetical protein
MYPAEHGAEASNCTNPLAHPVNMYLGALSKKMIKTFVVSKNWTGDRTGGKGGQSSWLSNKLSNERSMRNPYAPRGIGAVANVLQWAAATARLDQQGSLSAKLPRSVSLTDWVQLDTRHRFTTCSLPSIFSEPIKQD